MKSKEYQELLTTIEAKALAHRMAMSFIVQAVEELTDNDASSAVAQALRQIRERNLLMMEDHDPLREATHEELSNLIDMFST